MKKQTFLIILLTLGALGLSACETGMMGQKSQIEVQNQEDDIALTPPPEPIFAPAYQTGSQITYSGDSSVEIFDPNQNYMPPMNNNAMMGYGQGVQASDPSVTVYSLDNQVPPGIVSPFPMNNTASSYGVGGYAPMYGSVSASTDNQIFFTHGSSRLGSGDMQKLSSTAEQAKFAPVGRITVAGHASKPTQAGSQTVEGHILNLKESMNRSFAVSKTLMQKGVPAEKIKTVSWGSTQPTGDESQDRRVDVIMGDQ